jgi:hypothetical protein
MLEQIGEWGRLGCHCCFKNAEGEGDDGNKSSDCCGVGAGLSAVCVDTVVAQSFEKLRNERFCREHAGEKQSEHANACDVCSFVKILLQERESNQNVVCIATRCRALATPRNPSCCLTEEGAM